jgi:hypothetical protein
LSFRSSKLKMTTIPGSSHPISVISSFSAYRPSQKIKLNHNRTQFMDISEELENTLDQFDTLTDFAIDSYSVSDNEKIIKIKENARKSLVRSFLATDFLEKHTQEMRKITSTQMFNFIKDVIGTDSDKKRCKKAIETLTTATRNSNAEEKFSNFCARLKLISEEMIGADSAVKTHYVDKIFHENLPPTVRSFLLEQNSIHKSIEEIAKLLDKCEKYKKTLDVFQISAESSDMKIENLTNMIQSLADQNTALSEQNKSMMDLMKTKFQDVDAELNKIKTTPKTDFHQKSQKKEWDQPDQKSIPSSWELEKNGVPVRCTSCGFQGHSTSNCRGTCRATCHICRRQGHIAPACPERQQNKMAKNY